MSSENESGSDRDENWPVLLVGLLLVVGILVTACAISVLLLNRQKESQSTPQQEIPVMSIPTAVMPPAVLPTAMPVGYVSIRLPIVLSGSVSGTEQIWKVTNINSLGYELDGQRYDMATFTRIDGQATVQGYCINRGWNVPEKGTEYLLTSGNIFVPLYEPDTDPYQRFSMIQ